MSNEVLIKVEGVRKKFCRSLKKSLWYGVKDMGTEMLGGSRQHDQLRQDEFWAVQDVSFEVRRGECLGLIGRNGAGKTTLLRMLNGLIKPDHGRIEMHGRVGALIALGAGFNPILTGRENIYVNGSVLGLSKKEIDEKIDDIIDFAEIGEFIDVPVQSYSSGMQVRLGFAIATALEPDVLLLDEVLAVGDIAFRTKCFVRISALLSKAAVIFVSHTEEQLIRICSSGLVLKQGGIVHAGALKDCLNTYRELQPQNELPLLTYHAEGVKEAEIKLQAQEHASGSDLPFELHYMVDRNIDLALHVLVLLDEGDMDVAACDLLSSVNRIPTGTNTWKCVIGALSLRPGVYHFGLEALSTQHGSMIVRKRFPGLRLHVKESIAHWSNYTPQVSLAKS